MDIKNIRRVLKGALYESLNKQMDNVSEPNKPNHINESLTDFVCEVSAVGMQFGADVEYSNDGIVTFVAKRRQAALDLAEMVMRFDEIEETEVVALLQSDKGTAKEVPFEDIVTENEHTKYIVFAYIDEDFTPYDMELTESYIPTDLEVTAFDGNTRLSEQLKEAILSESETVGNELTKYLDGTDKTGGEITVHGESFDFPTSVEELNEVRRRIKVDSRGKRRIKMQCKQGFKWDGSACVKISGADLAVSRKAKRKAVITKKSQGVSLKIRTIRKTKKAKRFRKQMGLA
jgi:hypothetical protein